MTVNIPPRSRGKTSQKKAAFTIIDGLDFFFKYKRLERDATINTYNSQANLLIEFLSKKGFMDLAVRDFGKPHILEYTDHMNAQGLSQKTINSRLSFISSLFTFLVDRNKVDENPLFSVKKVKAKSQTKILLSNDEQKRLVQTLKEENEQLYLFVMFLFHNFIRPKELRLLQRQYIDLSTNRLTIPENIAKQNWRRTIITPPLRKIIIKHKLIEGDPTLPIFHNSANNVFGKNYFGEHYLKFRKKHGFPAYTKLYHWKDMGVSAYYWKFKDILFVKNQCGHQSLDMTFQYLNKDLGVIETDLNLEDSPEI